MEKIILPKIVLPEITSILNLLEEYSYGKLNEEEISRLFKVSLDFNTKQINEEESELAKFLKFIELCGEEGEYKIQSTIKENREGKIKGTKEQITISGHIISMFYLFIERELNILTKDCCNHAYFRENYETCYRHRFSLDELNAIIEDSERKNKGTYLLSKNENVGLQALSISEELDKFHICKPKEPKRKLYSFIYDLFVIRNIVNNIGRGYKGDIGKEKAEYIRNCIKAYKKKVGDKNNSERTHIMLEFF